MKSALSTDSSIDLKIHYEFGGPIGVTFMMGFFPMLMYYLHACIKINSGYLLYPSSFDVNEWISFSQVLIDSVEFSWETVFYYGAFILFEAVLAISMPGLEVQGLPVPSLGGKKMNYLCNGIASWYVTLCTVAGLHIAGKFNYIKFSLSWIILNFYPFLTASIIYGVLASLFVYIGAIVTKTTHRMSGNIFYDIFMGAPLHPRLFGGRLDLKMFLEIRVSWIVLFLVSLSACVHEFELRGHLSPQLMFMLCAHFLYTNACMKGEECIPTTWDIFYEKLGFMLTFWNISGVPFTYCLSTIYLHTRLVSDVKLELPSKIFMCTVFCVLLIAYYIWDTANSQKNRFRSMKNGTYKPRFSFPQLTWSTLEENCRFIQTKNGSTLLTDGWWRFARKIHYTADLVMALSWGLICGFDSIIPYFYFFFFTTVLVHRVTRDVEKCKFKYKEEWDEYCRVVPYSFIPYIY